MLVDVDIASTPSTWTYRLWLGVISLEVHLADWDHFKTLAVQNQQNTFSIIKNKKAAHIGLPWNTNLFKKKILTITRLTRKLFKLLLEPTVVYALDMHRNEIHGVSVILLAQIKTAVKRQFNLHEVSSNPCWQQRSFEYVVPRLHQQPCDQSWSKSKCQRLKSIFVQKSSVRKCTVDSVKISGKI